VITFDCGGTWFNFRAVAVVYDGPERRRVLLHTGGGDDFWSLPGGRVEPNEAAADAVVRELREELNAAARVERLLWVVENFYTHRGRATHELAMYFETTLPAAGPWREQTQLLGTEPGTDLVFRWFDVAAELPSTRVYPTFLVAGLANPPTSAAHLVHRDGP
jgi:8-oxo-dGTP pyrophosphatase MutT (NUDIX family)